VILTAACLAAQASAATPVKATLTVTSTTPAVGAPWRWTVRTTAAGKPAKATVKIQILLAGAVVGCWKGGKMRACTGASAGDPIASRGVLTKPIAWTQESRNVALTFQAVVRTGARTQKLHVALRVR
jgi:hypothetical protein